jgi:hypothetical protein
VEILIIKRVGIVSRSAGVIEWQLAAINSLSTPINRVLLSHEFHFDAALAELVRDHLANFFTFEMAVGRQI